MDNKLFDTPEDKKADSFTCRSCDNRERWQCGGSVIQYCGVRKSNRTENGLLKIKVTDVACPLYKPKGG